MGNSRFRGELGRRASSLARWRASGSQFLVGICLGAVLMILLTANQLMLLTSRETIQLRSSVGRDVVRPPEVALPSKEEAMALNDPFYLQMKGDPRFEQSIKVQQNFVAKKLRIAEVADRTMRFNTNQGEEATTILSDNFAYLQIWGNGKGTVVKALKEQHGRTELGRKDPESRKRKWMALVQDPIIHFLHGFAKYELNLLETNPAMESTLIKSWEDTTLSYDKRVLQFLKRVKTFTMIAPTAENSPFMHALPQSNYILKYDGSVHPNVALVGHTSEWQAMMEVAGFQGTPDDTIPDKPSMLHLKYFPADPSMLSDKTLVRLCEFLALDYYWFGLDAPAACQEPGGPLDPTRFQQL
eukprot:Nitzschia sp. Nitz4//scaffold22_size323478//35548//36615//NITZ4_000499-RA/size323478-processed-gene-0.441-mRNA-1//-1//CDS//3329542911//3793//frame0